MIESFSKEVIEQLKYYVYRLIDPRNGKTFYVGKGVGNRVFAHANAVDMSFYKNRENRNYENDDSANGNNDPAKIKTIMEIKALGLPVLHMIQRWGLDAKTAYEIEASFIDYFGLENLTNKISGHNREMGMVCADELESNLTAETFDDENCPYRYVLIKIKDYWINRNGGNNPDGIYQTVRGNWKIKPDKANKYPYVLAVRYGIVEGVYQINKDGWKYCSDGNRAYFDGIEAPENVKSYFYKKKIPEKYQKRQNPTSYSK